MHLHRFTRTTTRLQNHDYSSGTYFITLSAYKHACLFGDITNNSFHPNNLGSIISTHLNSLSARFPNVKILSSQLMPNHLHLIIEIKPTNHHSRGLIHQAQINQALSSQTQTLSLQKSNQHMGLINQTPTLGHIIRYFKAITTHESRQQKDNPFFIWQRNYYEHIIRDPSDLIQKTKYIENNVNTWPHDQDNPKNIKPTVGASFMKPDITMKPDTNHIMQEQTNFTNRRGVIHHALHDHQSNLTCT